MEQFTISTNREVKRLAPAKQEKYVPHREYKKYAYGVACCRIHNGVPEVLLICNANSFAFVNFMTSITADRPHKLGSLFSGMTYREKQDILSLGFEALWPRICSAIPQPPATQAEYNQSMEKVQYMFNSLKCNKKVEIDYDMQSWVSYQLRKMNFEALKADMGRLKRKMNSSTNSHTLWGLPKGRKNARETDIDTATREFCEETGATADVFRIYYDQKPVVDVFKDTHKTYVVTIYVAQLLKDDWIPKIKFNSDALQETQDAQWYSYSRIKALIGHSTSKYDVRLLNMVKNSLNSYKQLRKD